MIPCFDAHCDTALPVYQQGKSLYQNDLHLDLKRLSAYAPCGQVFAVCVEHGPDMVSRTEAVIRNFLREIDTYPDAVQLCRSAADISAAEAAGKVAALLSVEGADRLGASAEGLKRFYDLGVRIVHITWNDENPLCGTAIGSNTGLTEAGRDFVRTAEALGVVPDMSHISERGFWDVLEIAEKPVLAGHSNALSLCPFPRNLSDEQFVALIKIGGAKEVYACATHGVLSGPAIERLEASPIKKLTLLDTIPLPAEKRIDKIELLQVAPVFTEAIARIYEESSVSPLFD